MGRGRALADDVGTQVRIADGNQQMRADPMHRHNSSGLEFKFGCAHAILHEQDLLGTVGQDFDAAFFRPVRGCLAQRLVLHQFDGHVAKRLRAHVLHKVRKSRGHEAGIAVGEFDVDSGFVLHRIGHLGCAEGDRDVVVAMPVHQRLRARGNLDVENAHRLVLEG